MKTIGIIGTGSDSESDDSHAEEEVTLRLPLELAELFLSDTEEEEFNGFSDLECDWELWIKVKVNFTCFVLYAMLCKNCLLSLTPDTFSVHVHFLCSQITFIVLAYLTLIQPVLYSYINVITCLPRLRVCFWSSILQNKLPAKEMRLKLQCDLCTFFSYLVIHFWAGAPYSPENAICQEETLQ